MKKPNPADRSSVRIAGHEPARPSRRLVLRRLGCYCLAAVCGVVPLAADPLADLVLIVSIDGLRPDALAKASTPNLDALCSQGAYTWSAQTVVPSITLVSHTSMLTGVEPKRHGITTDTQSGRTRPLQVATCFELAKRAGYPTSMIVGKTKLKRIAKAGTVDHYSYAGYWAKQVAAEAVKRLAHQKSGLMFLHFPDPDSLGHQHGWMSARQLKGVEDCDAALGRVLSALSGHGLRGRTLVIVTADHGGHGKVHGTRDPLDMTIPWICSGPGVRLGHRIQGAVRLYDTAPTVLYALGLPVPSDWQGSLVGDAFATAAATH